MYKTIKLIFRDENNKSSRQVVYKDDKWIIKDDGSHNEFYTNEFVNNLIDKLQTDVPVNTKIKFKNERRENRSLSNEIPFTNKVIQRNLETVNSTNSIETVYKNKWFASYGLKLFNIYSNSNKNKRKRKDIVTFYIFNLK